MEVTKWCNLTSFILNFTKEEKTLELAFNGAKL